MAMSNFGPRHLVAVLFGSLGTITISLNLIAVALRGVDSDDAMFLPLSALYGVSAVLTGYGLWKRARLGEIAFLVWCATIAAFMVGLFSSDPSLLDPWLIPGLLTTTAVLFYGWLRIRRACSHAA